MHCRQHSSTVDLSAMVPVAKTCWFTFISYGAVSHSLIKLLMLRRCVEIFLSFPYHSLSTVLDRQRLLPSEKDSSSLRAGRHEQMIAPCRWCQVVIINNLTTRSRFRENTQHFEIAKIALQFHLCLLRTHRDL